MDRVFSVIMALLLTSPVVSANPRWRSNERPAPGRYIVHLDAAADVEEATSGLVRAFGGKVVHRFHGEPWQGFSVQDLPHAAAMALSNHPLVEYVEEDSYEQLLQVAPPQHDNWARDRINQDSLPLDLDATTCGTGANAYIYVIDSGISDPGGAEFGSRLTHLWKRKSAWTYDDNKNHGTSVASIAAGQSSGASRANVVNVKISEPGDNSTASDAAFAIREYVNTHQVGRPKIVNMSLRYGSTTTGVSALEADILSSIQNHNVTFVVGAGNENQSCSLASPARLGTNGGVVTVGAMYLRPDTGYMTEARSVHLQGDGVALAWGSNYGSCVDLFAPGTRVRALSNAGALHEFSGTSAAAPFVAGYAARLASVLWSSSGGIIPTAAAVETEIKNDSVADKLDWASLSGSPNRLLRVYATGPCRF